MIAYEGRARIVAQTDKSYVRASGPEGETPNVLGGYYLTHIMMAFALMFAVKNYFYRALIYWFSIDGDCYTLFILIRGQLFLGMIIGFHYYLFFYRL